MTYRLWPAGSRNESNMRETTEISAPIRVAGLDPSRGAGFALRPDAAGNAALAGELGLLGLRKLSFRGTVTAEGKRDWRLSGQLGATVTQACVVSLAPVTTRLEVAVERLFVAGLQTPGAEEAEMPEDDTREPLGAEIDPGAVMVEALSLALPDYPRAKGAETGEAVFAEDGVTPLRDEDTRPFAGLAGLREAMKGENGDGA